MSTVTAPSPISNALDITEAKASYDAACKHLLGQKEIQVHILKSFVDELADVPIETIFSSITEMEAKNLHMDEPVIVVADMPTESSSVTEGTRRFDALLSVMIPGILPKKVIVNIEAQRNSVKYPLENRIQYYMSRMISNQYLAEFRGEHYENIKKIYSIWFCMPDVQKKFPFYQIVMGSVDETGMAVLDQCLGKGKIIYLDKPEDYVCSTTAKLMSVLFSDEMSAAQKKFILSNEYGISMTQEIEKELITMCNLSELIEEKAMARGMEKGLKQGIEQGIEQGMVKTAKAFMKSMNLSLEQVLTVLEIPEDERPAVVEALSEAQG